MPDDREQGGMSVVALPRRAAAKKRQDAAFLPAALEIIETPASPAGRWVAATIIAFLCVALLWSIFGQVDIIATAQGRIIPMGKSKVIQPFETGVVREIKVADGEVVRAGDVLVELDQTTDVSDEQRLAFALMQDRLDILRLTTLLEGKARFDAPAEAEEKMVSLAHAQLDAQLAEVHAKIEGIERQIAQKEAEGREIKATLAKIAGSLPLISEQRDIRKALLGNQYGSRLSYLQVQQQVVESQNEMDAQIQRQEENAQSLAALDRQRAQVTAEYRKNLLTDLAKAGVLASEHKQETTKSAMRRTLRTLRAPVGGTVQQLAVHTLGGIVTPAEQLMVVVPHGTGLEIEAQVANRDVGFVHKGQPVEIKVETFSFTRYGLLHGTVASISKDAVAGQAANIETSRGARRSAEEVAAEQERQAGTPTYVAHIALAATGMQTERGFTALEPGMAVTAEIKTGKRSIIEFLLSPLQRLKSESLRER